MFQNIELFVNSDSKFRKVLICAKTKPLTKAAHILQMVVKVLKIKMGLTVNMAMLNTFLFYAFSFVLVLSCIFSVISKKSVHSVLWLILGFFGAAWVLLSLRADFIAMVLIIVYVGAIAILFLFVVMMLEEPNSAIKKVKYKKLHMFFSLSVTIILFFEIFAILLTSKSANLITTFIKFDVKDLGKVLYTTYFFEFQSLGILFFVAMVGVIVLTLEERPKNKIQNAFRQISRQKSSVYLVKPETYKGVKID